MQAAQPVTTSTSPSPSFPIMLDAPGSTVMSIISGNPQTSRPPGPEASFPAIGSIAEDGDLDIDLDEACSNSIQLVTTRALEDVGSGVVALNAAITQNLSLEVITHIGRQLNDGNWFYTINLLVFLKVQGFLTPPFADLYFRYSSANPLGNHAIAGFGGSMRKLFIS